MQLIQFEEFTIGSVVYFIDNKRIKKGAIHSVNADIYRDDFNKIVMDIKAIFVKDRGKKLINLSKDKCFVRAADLLDFLVNEKIEINSNLLIDAKDLFNQEFEANTIY